MAPSWCCGGWTRSASTIWNRRCSRGAEWIRHGAEFDGGWGETCGTYDDPDLRGEGESTPSQTGLALLGLLAAGDDRSDSLAKGVRWL